MPAILFVLNVLWFVLGGFVAGLLWCLAGVIMAVTIVGLPWARACFMLARFSFWPFGYDIVARDKLTGVPDIGTGTAGTIGNVIWFVLAGWWLAIAHISAAIALAITVIGIPFAWQHVKLAIASLFPIGKSVVAVERIMTPVQGLPLRQIGKV
ncbi:MAG: YccF domain-containing protein [Hyphomicrobiales bacterium]